MVIGNSAYRNAPPLKNPTNDASDIAARLRSLEFDVVEGIDLDMNSMRRSVREFVRKTEGADLAVFFYAGHGLQVNGSNYLVPVDANLSSITDLQFETLPVDFVLGPMEVNAKTSIVFLDACRDNPLARSLARSMGTRSSAIGTGLAEIGGGIGTLISYATQPGNVALDGEGRNSPFTAALLTHLGKPGAGITGTMTAVRRDVLASTNGKQVPWEHSSLTGVVVLKPRVAVPDTPVAGGGTAKDNPAPRPGAADVELTLWRAIESS
ncbi:MAG TPA: caspase domain-containing protein, partial [Afifellaceae bacterium]|nr:caspase domain-containing protein [Afifellaceae bacterium]